MASLVVGPGVMGTSRDACRDLATVLFMSSAAASSPEGAREARRALSASGVRQHANQWRTGGPGGRTSGAWGLVLPVGCGWVATGFRGPFVVGIRPVSVSWGHRGEVPMWLRGAAVLVGLLVVAACGGSGTATDVSADGDVVREAAGDVMVINGCAIEPNAQCAGADLAGANLRGAVLFEANLQRAVLTGAQLANANLVAATLVQANLSGASMSAVELIRADLSGADLTGADLSVADLAEAVLFEANLSDANLSEAELSQVDLGGANLSGVNLSGANLSGASLSGADTTGAVFCETGMPDGSINNSGC